MEAAPQAEPDVRHHPEIHFSSASTTATSLSLSFIGFFSSIRSAWTVETAAHTAAGFPTKKAVARNARDP